MKNYADTLKLSADLQLLTQLLSIALIPDVHTSLGWGSLARGGGMEPVKLGLMLSSRALPH